MKRNSIKKFILYITFLTNFLFSCAVFAIDLQGVQQIKNCVENCLGIITPTNITVFTNKEKLNEKYHFISNEIKNIFFITKSDNKLGNDFIVYDFREDGGLNLSVTATDFISDSNKEKRIPFKNIGIFTFNKGTNSSIDTTSNYNLTSSIDPVEKEVIPKEFEPYNYFSFISSPISPNDQDFQNFYTKFTGSETISDPINIINAPLPEGKGRFGLYKFGIGGVVEIPEDFILSFKDDNYQTTLTFTIVS